ncbi:MAG: ABC transporter permease [Anaerolineae bacterium]|nr:ABC transporter permease [Anaerolineae bacterium]
MIGEILAIAVKEIQVLLRDKGSLAVLFLLPLLFAVVLGMPSQLAMKASEGEEGLVVTTYLVNEDSGPYGAQIVAALEEVSMLDLVVVDTQAGADRRIADGEAPAAVVIPADFSARIDAGESVLVTVLADPAQGAPAGIVTGIVNQIVGELATIGELRYGVRAVLAQSGAAGASPQQMQAVEAQVFSLLASEVQALRQEPAVTLTVEDMEGSAAAEPWNPFSYYMPSFAVAFSFFLVGFIAARLLEEKELGTFRRLLISPMRRGSIIAGKVLAYMSVVFAQALVLLGIGALAFDMPLGSSPLGLFLIALVTALAASSLGLLIGAVSRTSGQADNLGTLLGFILMAAGGCVYPFFREGGVMAAISRLTPHAHALEAYMRLMSDGYGLAQVLPHILIVAGFAALFFAAAMWRFRME